MNQGEDQSRKKATVTFITSSASSVRLGTATRNSGYNKTTSLNGRQENLKKGIKIRTGKKNCRKKRAKKTG